MMSELRSKLSKFILIRNITVVLLTIILIVLSIVFVMPYLYDLMEDLGRKSQKYSKYIMAIGIAGIVYLVVFGFNRIINNDILTKIFNSIDSRIRLASFKLFYRFKEGILEDIMKKSSIPYGDIQAAVSKKTLFLKFDNNIDFFMSEFRIIKRFRDFINSEFKGMIAVFTDKNLNFNGKALFLDKSLYEKGKAASFYSEYDSSAQYSINNDVIKNNFHIYFSNAEMADKICKDNVIDAIVQIKTVYNKNLSISFADDKIYIIVEKEETKLKTNEKDFENYMNKIKLLVNLYDSLK